MSLILYSTMTGKSRAMLRVTVPVHDSSNTRKRGTQSVSSQTHAWAHAAMHAGNGHVHTRMMLCQGLLQQHYRLVRAAAPTCCPDGGGGSKKWPALQCACAQHDFMQHGCLMLCATSAAYLTGGWPWRSC
jgi:hypothetical protein